MQTNSLSKSAAEKNDIKPFGSTENVGGFKNKLVKKLSDQQKDKISFNQQVMGDIDEEENFAQNEQLGDA